MKFANILKIIVENLYLKSNMIIFVFYQLKILNKNKNINFVCSFIKNKY